MKRYLMATAAMLSVATATPAMAQSAQRGAPPPAKSQVPLGMIADREALTAMDYIEIQQLYARYAASLDLGDGAARASTFTADGSYANLPSNHQPVSVTELARRTTAAGNNGDRHLVHNLIITPTKEGADGFAYLMFVNPAGKVHMGFYVDKLVKTVDGWRFGPRHGWYDNDPGSPYRGKRPGDAAPPAGAKP